MSELSVPAVSTSSNALSPQSSAALTPRFRARVGPMLTALNLHFAGLAVLALLNIYLLLHLFFLWRATANNNATALANQMVERKTAEIQAEPLRGLDAKLVQATEEADAFSARRLPFADSQAIAELGALAKQENVKLAGVQYGFAPVLTGSAHELTQIQMDASLSGDYRPLVQFINALERDKQFFVIEGVALSGQQSGTVGLRLRLTTYLRPAKAGEVSKQVVVEDPAVPGSVTVAPVTMVTPRQPLRTIPMPRPNSMPGGPVR